MLDPGNVPGNVPGVDPQERLSRFILTKRHVNQETKQLKADAFLPHPHEELSVTRDRDASELEIWRVGLDVAEKRGKSLHGRGDAIAATYLSQKLKTVADPISGNPNHVNITDWPSADDKAAQKLVAQEIAAVAKFIPTLDV